MFRMLAALTLLLLVSAMGRAQAPRERKNIDKLTAGELAAYKHAISVLQKSTDPKNNYAYHAALHNLFVITPPHGCEHGNDLFFPWHRRHLANFEKALQDSDPTHATLSTKDVTIPYWDWTQKATGKRYAKDFENEFDAAERNPLYDDFRNTDASAPIYTEEYMTGIVRNNSDWDKFAGGPKDTNEFYGALEIDSHNTMHGTYIGGDMADPGSAAMDPIYWSFHAFIDLQWDRWQKIFEKPPTSLDKVLRGFNNAPTVKGTVDVNDLGYFYTHTAKSIEKNPVVAAPNLAPQALRFGSSLEGAERTVAVWGGAGPFDFKGNVPQAFQRADVWFDDMKIPELRSYRVEVFIYPVGRKYRASDSVGSLTVWKGHVGLDGKKHHNTANMFMPVTETLKRITAANPEKELTVTVVVTPIKQAPRPKSTSAPAATPVEDEIQFKSVRVILNGGGPFHKTGDKHGH